MRKLLIISVLTLCAITAVRAQDLPPPTANTGNQSTDKLLTMPEYGQAAMLSKATRYSCIGVNPYYMGTEITGSNKGVSFWSITCKGTDAKFMIAIAPDEAGSTKVFSCNMLEGHPNWECYKRLKDLPN